MKKTILGVAVLAIVLIMMIGSVNAASISLTPNNTEIKKGETVRVTVSVDPTSAIQFDLSYDNSKFEFIGASAGTLGDDAGAENSGVVSVASFALDGKTKTETATVDFKAIATTDAGEVAFTIDGLVTESMETVAEPTIKVTVVEPTTENPNPENPNPVNPEVPGTNEGNDGTNSEIIGTNGQVINKLPNTGTPIFIGALAIIVVASVTLALVIKKAK